jgi:hypothetical protein
MFSSITQCQRLPHEWGLEKGITEGKVLPPQKLCRDGFEPIRTVKNIKIRRTKRCSHH